MSGTINGIGTTVCPGRGEISWTPGPWYLRTSDYTDYDGVECFCVLFLPIIPFKCIHVFAREGQFMGERYRTVPLRWSWSLIARAFAKRWLYVLIPLGVVTSCYLFVDMIILGIAGVVMVITGIIAWILLSKTDQRDRDIRRIKGPSELGSSDPVTWPEDFLANFKDSRSILGTATFSAAARGALTRNEFARAMQAARYCAAVEDSALGESLTDEILSHPEVQQALPETHADPIHWEKHFGKHEVEELADFI